MMSEPVCTIYNWQNVLHTPNLHRTWFMYNIGNKCSSNVVNREINYSPKLDVECVMSTNSSIHTALVCTDGLIMCNSLQSISFYVDISEQPL